MAKILKSNERTKETWRGFAMALLVKITIFNVRRPFEAGMMTLSQYEGRNKGSKDVAMNNILTNSEKLIAQNMSIVLFISMPTRGEIQVAKTKLRDSKVQ